MEPGPFGAEPKYNTYKYYKYNTYKYNTYKYNTYKYNTYIYNTYKYNIYKYNIYNTNIWNQVDSGPRLNTTDDADLFADDSTIQVFHIL